MNILMVCCLATSALALPQGYGAPPSAPVGYGAPPSAPAGYGQSCGPNEILHVDGRCVRPIVNRNVFLYAAPEQEPVYGPPPQIPDPKVDYNLVFVQTPDDPEDQDPIIVPPPQQKTLVYVLNQAEDPKGQEVIEVPSNAQSPEVFYVNYNEGENLQLPGGIDINTALSSANAQQGQVIEGVGSVGGGYGEPPIYGGGSSSGNHGASYS